MPVRSPAPRSSAMTSNARAPCSSAQRSCVTYGRSGNIGFDRLNHQRSSGFSEFCRFARFESPRWQLDSRCNGYGLTLANCGYHQELCKGYGVCPADVGTASAVAVKGQFSRVFKGIKLSLEHVRMMRLWRLFPLSLQKKSASQKNMCKKRLRMTLHSLPSWDM